MQQHYLQYHWFGRHYSLGYRAHGDVTSPNVLLCVHGVSRNAKDFDVIAEALADHYHVIALDMPGRGQSEWLEEKGHYGQQLYEIVTGQIMGMTGAKQLDWLGTSMGGMLGMRVASREQSPIRRMVLNDIGPLSRRRGGRRTPESSAWTPALPVRRRAWPGSERTAPPLAPLPMRVGSGSGGTPCGKSRSTNGVWITTQA
jgi:pimeloyl-ACP methyl ester carboxylesterase